MQNIRINLESKASESFKTTKAANSCDLNLKEKLTYEINIENIEIPKFWNIGLIIGNSGTGKTTIAKQIFNYKEYKFDYEKNVLDNFEDNISYENCIEFLNAVGFSNISCYCRPMKTLSNGQKTRAEIALMLSKNQEIIVIDEFTSVVDRLSAKAMSLSISKAVKKLNKKIILCSCHFDIIDFICPDWIIDTSKQKFYLYVKKKEKNYDFTLNNVINQNGEIIANIII